VDLLLEIPIQWILPWALARSFPDIGWEERPLGVWTQREAPLLSK